MSDLLTSPGSDPLLTPGGMWTRKNNTETLKTLKNLIYSIPAKSIRGAESGRGRGWWGQ